MGRGRKHKTRKMLNKKNQAKKKARTKRRAEAVKAARKQKRR